MEGSTVTPDQIALTIFAFICAVFVYKVVQGKREDARIEAERAAAWAADYHNPASPNYDAARVAAEEAAAWAEDPTNPDSPNYDPSA